MLHKSTFVHNNYNNDELIHLKWEKDTRKHIEVDAGERLEAAEVAEDCSDDFLEKRNVKNGVKKEVINQWFTVEADPPPAPDWSTVF